MLTRDLCSGLLPALHKQQTQQLWVSVSLNTAGGSHDKDLPFELQTNAEGINCY